MTTNAHKFTAVQIDKIAKQLGIAPEAVKVLEDDENLEIEVQGTVNKLVTYLSVDADTGVVVMDVFLDDNSLDNEEAYQDSIKSDESLNVLDESIESVLKEFMEKFVVKA